MTVSPCKPLAIESKRVSAHYPYWPKNTGSVEISVVIPVYNSETTLIEFWARLDRVLSNLRRTYEVIFIDDGSHDGSWTVLKSIQSSASDRMTAIQLMRNFGQHNALMCGLRQSSGMIVITLDDDLQNPPEEIPKLILEIERDSIDLVYGRSDDKQHASWRNFGSMLTQVFYRRVFGLRNGVSAFRAIRKELVECIVSYDLNYTYLDGLFAWHTDRISEVAVLHHPRVSGSSGYSLRRLVVLSINLFTNFSLLPLQIATWFGISAASIGFFAGFYYTYLKVFDNIDVPGFTSLIVSMLVIGGIQLIALGVIGEYLGRVHMNANHKPQYSKRVILKRLDS